MNVWAIIGLVVAGMVILPLLIAALPQRKPHNLTREDVAGEIEAFLDGRGGTFDWDDFCTFTLADPELDKIRARCAHLDEEFPPSSPGGYCNEEGLKVLRRYVEYLRGSDAGLDFLPTVITAAGEGASHRFIEFFTANIRNKNTRVAYVRALVPFFGWCEDRGISLHEIRPVHVAAYIEQHSGSAPTVKQHLAAIRMMFDWLVIGQIMPVNPSSSVRGPKHVVKRGKTPVLKAEQARLLIDSIDISSISGLRDRALIGVMVYSFARVSAVTRMRVEDYYQNGRRWWFRLHEKGGKRHDVPAHHNGEAYIDAYLETAGIVGQKKSPLFRTIDKHRKLSENPMYREDVLCMIKRRATDAGLPATTCCHTFRATGITAYLENGGTIENAQAIAAHESPRTTKLYDRTSDEITLDEVERILI